MLSYDLEKNLLPELLLLLKDSDKFLLLDFLVERFNLIKMPCGSLLTHNNEIKNILTVSNIGEFELVDKFSEEKLNLFKKYWCEFWRLAHEYGFANRIILNKLFMTKKINNKSKFNTDKLNVINATNEFLSCIYNVVEKDVKNILSYPEECLVADSKHKWGLTPFHFTSEFYSFQIKELCFMVNNFSS